jgi:N-glycosylase/DNA lyase
MEGKIDRLEIKIDSKEFNLEHIFDCGQCFRWDKFGGNSYVGVAFGEAVKISLSGEKLVIEGSKNLQKWNNYFDLDRNYGEIKETLCCDEKLKKCIEKAYGIRILRQDPFETIISFIISANNNIPRIKGSIRKICVSFGEKIDQKFDSNDGKFFSFPTSETLANLTEDELRKTGVGFRAKYIIKTCQDIVNNNIDFDLFRNLPTSEISEKLQKFPGVGPKIASCVLLFAYARYDSFPQDVWIRRILNREYGIEDKSIGFFADQKFGKYAGFAQQYLYYYFKDFSAKAG